MERATNTRFAPHHLVFEFVHARAFLRLRHP